MLVRLLTISRSLLTISRYPPLVLRFIVSDGRMFDGEALEALDDAAHGHETNHDLLRADDERRGREEAEERRDRREIRGQHFRSRRLVQYHDSNRRFLQRVQIANQCHLVHKCSIDGFAKDTLRAPNTNIFVHQSAGDGKSYLHGEYRSMFDFLHQVSQCTDNIVNADEIIPYNQPVRMFFDLEIKQISGDVATSARGYSGFMETLYLNQYRPILEEHVKGSVELAHNSGLSTYNPSPVLVNAACLAYYRVRSEPFTESVCRAGMRILLAYIKQFLKKRIENYVTDVNDKPWDEIYVCSGCRSDKFSLHVVLGRIFFDRVFISCPLVVFEIARYFVMKNVVWLLRSDDRSRWYTPEGEFRLRCLMLEELMTNTNRFRGMRDSVFDEGVYSRRHPLRLPGCRKPAGDSPLPIHPVAVPTDLNDMESTPPQMMMNDSDFQEMFPLGQDGLERWLRHTVHGKRRDLDSWRPRPDYMFAGWSPTEFFIGDMDWQLRKNEELRNGNHFDPRAAENQGFILVGEENHSVKRYPEYRRSVKIALTEEEKQLYGRGIDWRTMTAEFDPHEKFRVRSTQEVLPFVDIPPDTMIHHKHLNQTREETMASAKTWKIRRGRGFQCWTCGVNFWMKSDGDDFEIEPRYCFSEEQIREAYIPGTDPPQYYKFISDPNKEIALRPEFFLSKKWTVLDALMGSGKTEELANLVKHLKLPSDQRKRILVVTFRMSLAYQMAKRFRIPCYKVDRGSPPPADGSSPMTQEELDEKICNDEFDALVICVNSLGKIGSKKWDIVILDECGLIRLHCLSSITAPHLGRIITELKNALKNADHVILSQEFVAEKDVEFYMSLDNANVYDDRAVNALRFVKPVKIHPIKHSTNFFASVHKLLEC